MRKSPLHILVSAISAVVPATSTVAATISPQNS